MWYPTVEKVVEYNLLALSLIPAKKADKSELLNRQRLILIIEACENMDGDVYEKAVRLFKGLITMHPFASGNRRTAFIVTKEFLQQNGAKFEIKDDPQQSKAMTGVREGYYTDQEIKEWIKHGKIKDFRR